MLKSAMRCSSCIYSEFTHIPGQIRCIRDPKATLKNSQGYCGQGEWRSYGIDKELIGKIKWGDWEEEDAKKSTVS